MTTRSVAQRQNQIDKQVLEQLAVLGGLRTKDDEIIFEGTAFRFPSSSAATSKASSGSSTATSNHNPSKPTSTRRSTIGRWTGRTPPTRC